MELANRVVFVTGANRGIGKSLVEALLKRDVAKIYATSRSLNKIPNFSDERVVNVELDVTNHQQVVAAAKLANDTDILFNNAGVAAYGSILDNNVELVKRDMDTNYFGTLDMMKEFIPVLEKRKSTAIVNIVSIAAFVNFPSLGGYCASKSALFSLTQGARIELKSKGISVHSVNPGPIDTDMAADFEAEKTSPADTADAILNALGEDQMDIFPDPGGRGMFDVWKQDYRELEDMVAKMHSS